MSGASLDRRCRASRVLTLAVLTRSHGPRPSPCLGPGEDGWAPGVTSPRTATFTGLPGQSSRGQVPLEARVLAPWSPRPEAGPGAAAASPSAAPRLPPAPFPWCQPQPFPAVPTDPPPAPHGALQLGWALSRAGCGRAGCRPPPPQGCSSGVGRGGAWSHIRASEAQPGATAE